MLTGTVYPPDGKLGNALGTNLPFTKTSSKKNGQNVVYFSSSGVLCASCV